MKRSVLITGASSGIGAATARLLAARDFEVYGTSRDPERLGPDAPAVHWIAMDVTDEDSVRHGVARAQSASGGLYGLVCNAGTGIFGSVEETPIERARAQLETNVFGTLRALRAVLPGLREAGRGRAVVVGSLAGRAPIPFQAHYSASKAALDALVLALRNELAGTGVSVSLVEPGDLRTAFNERTLWSDTSRSVYGERIRRAERVIREILPRAPQPDVAARAIHRALTARRPRVRYPVGPNAWGVPLGRRLLPDALVLRLIRAHFRV